MSDEPERTLTDADIDAILTRAQSKFYGDLGKGVWSLVWKGIVVTLLAVAAYGAFHGR